MARPTPGKTGVQATPASGGRWCKAPPGLHRRAPGHARPPPPQCHSRRAGLLACWFGVDRSTITRAIGEVRPLLATRGCTIAPGIRLRTLAEVIDHLGAGGRAGIIDGTEIRVRRPAAGRKDREKFISGKNKQNAVKAMILTDASGRLLFCSPAQPASCADTTHARQLVLQQRIVS